MRRKRNRPFTHSRLYGFYKARLLDGTLDRGPRYGSYCITAMRVWAGWGQVAEWRWPMTRGPVVWPPVEPSGLDRIAKYRRSFAHFRVRNIDDLKRAIIAPALVLFSVPITRSWRTASGGVIPIPPDPRDFTEYHAVAGGGYSDTTGHIELLNSWGPNWGGTAAAICLIVISRDIARTLGFLGRKCHGIGCLRNLASLQTKQSLVLAVPQCNRSMISGMKFFSDCLCLQTR